MRDNGSKAKALALIAEAQSQAGWTDDARTILDQALAVARSIAHLASRNAALLVVSGYAARAGIEPQAQASLDEALGVALAISFPEQRFSALLQTAEAYGARGQTAKIPGALVEARAAAIGTGRAVAIMSVARAQMAAGLSADAVATLRQAPNSPTAAEKEFVAGIGDDYDFRRAGILGAIARAQAQAGLNLEALDSFNDAHRIALTIGNPGVRAQALGTIAAAGPAIGLAANAIIDEALASLNDALRHPASRERRDELLYEFAVILVTTERGLSGSEAAAEIPALLEKTYRVAKAVANPSIRENILRSIVDELAESGQVDQAMRVMQDIETPGARVGALVAVANALPN